MVRKAIEKVDLLFKKLSQNFKCQHCDFEAKHENGLNMHKKSTHQNKSKYKCSSYNKFKFFEQALNIVSIYKHTFRFLTWWC